MKCIIVDIDGTLANNDHRRGFLEGKKDWKRFFNGMGDDLVNEWCKEIIDRFKGDYRVVLLSGRGEEYMSITRAWLEDNGIYYDELYMRRAGDMRDDVVVKKELYEGYVSDEVLFVIDDRARVVEMWRGLGLVVLQCAEGNF